jgi:bifunctional non-homologous end joining protein LigD
MREARSAQLELYASKRDFNITAEPAPAAIKRQGPLLFVVHEHAARRLHYDLRLELDGILKCWAIPNGFDMKPGKKRLAVETEDHPLDYASFEGVIPAKQYGAGKVIVWDCGLYSPNAIPPSFADRKASENGARASLAHGKLSFTLAGTKLKGTYALVRTRENWLLLKHDDGIPIVSSELALSPLSGHTVTDVPSAACPHTAAALAPSGRQTPVPRRIAIMTAEAGQAPFSHPDWMFEPKLDGYRITAFIADGTVRLITRGGHDYASYFPEIVRELASQPVQPLVVDGEILALKNGKPSFEALSLETMKIGNAEPCVTFSFYCFDLLHAAGVDTRINTYSERRRFLKQCLTQGRFVQIVHAQSDGVALYKAALDTGLEGVVGKRNASIYQSGKRSSDWIKIKPRQTAEFVIIGYNRAAGGIGSVLLAFRDENGVLQYAGRAGSGLDRHTASRLADRFNGIRRGTPAADNVSVRATWVEPVVVAEISYYEMTESGKLRHPVFVRLRDDLDASSVMAPVNVTAALPVTADLATLEKELDALGSQGTLSVGGHPVTLSRLDKVLWPAHERYRALTKRDLLRYLMRVSPRFLPVLRNRPLTLIRMPDGITGQSFFQKHLAQKLPNFMEVRADPAAGKEDRKPLLVCNNLASLLWLGNLGTLEYHVWHSSFDGMDSSLLDRPDYLAFDLDPFVYSGKESKGEEPLYNRKGFNLCVRVAFWLKEVLDALGLQSYVKTTGKTGLHVFVPIKRTITFAEAKRICELVGRHVLQSHSDAVTMEWNIAKRDGKIFIDHNMNGRGKTLLAAWSPRAQPAATYSAPVTWKTLETLDPLARRLPAYGNGVDNEDTWGSMLKHRQSLDVIVGS